MTEEEGWRRLAEQVGVRRRWLGLRQTDLQARGGPSAATVRNIEQATRPSFSEQTVSSLDIALKWRSGIAAQIVAGTAPADTRQWEADPTDFEHGAAMARAGRTFNAAEFDRDVPDHRDLLGAVGSIRGGKRALDPAAADAGAYERVEQWDTPSLVIGQRVRQLRAKRGWSLQRLAGECFRVQQRSLDDDALLRIESGTRGYVTVDEAMTLAYVLDCALVNLLVPVVEREDVDAHRYWVAPDIAMTVNQARQWARGDRDHSSGRIVAPGVDPEAYLDETPPQEWRPIPRSAEEIHSHAEDIRAYRDIRERVQPAARLLRGSDDPPLHSSGEESQ